MKSPNSRSLAGCLVMLRLLAPLPADAERLGEHPAVSQKRAQAAAGYDYASRFYPHPAWLYLLPYELGATPAPIAGVLDQSTRAAGLIDAAVAAAVARLAVPDDVGQRNVAVGPVDKAAIFYRPLRRAPLSGALR